MVIDWITEMLAAPDRAHYQPFQLYPEQEEFVLQFYELDPRTGRRRYRRAVLCRPRGWGKSPLLAAISIVEALAPVYPDGWDAEGQPVGKPWSEVRTPLVQIAAVSEAQTKNTWSPLLEMLQGPVLDAYPGLEPLEGFVNLPRAGRIEPITSSARTIKGNRPIFAVLDQSEEWVKSNRGTKLAETIRINAAKTGGTTLESPNAYTPGEGSVAEMSARDWNRILEGKALDTGMFYDTREAPPDTNLYDRDELRQALAYVYGDSADVNGGHVDLDVLVSTIMDSSTDPQTARADFLNQVTHAQTSYLSQPEWGACKRDDRALADGDMVALGFDGAIRNDSTALVACRLSDGHTELLGLWEKPEGPAGEDWAVPGAEVNATVTEAFRRFNVAAMYCDPAHWQDYVDRWAAAYGDQVHVRATADRPFHWWTNRHRLMVAAVSRFEEAVRQHEVSHNGDLALTRHVLNARRRVLGQSGISVAKEFAGSSNKIDALVATILAYTARMDCIARGVNNTPTAMGGWSF
ncbi:phage terminase family protein [Nocardiopsis exhalans]|uniref:Phage terminase family protein n=1 Tax=Nocardiopsis exhalans TaxID=163604 RepID=A0ABY5DEG1_9ACTN|nr:phage terminase family protein [Nocardiopsis exhalans]USY21759.1 phage terminase family protein [Nocardiopsis exhalans]